jgi:hypothetical protein
MVAGKRRKTLTGDADWFWHTGALYRNYVSLPVTFPWLSLQKLSCGFGGPSFVLLM